MSISSLSIANIYKTIDDSYAQVRKIPSNSWRHFGALGTARILRITIGFCSSILWARYVSLETYGQYQLITSLMGIVAGFCLGGLDQSLTISAAKSYDGNLLKIVSIRTLAALGGSIALAGSSFYYSETQPIVSIGLLIASVFFPVYELQKIWNAWLSGKGQLSLLAGLKILGNILSISTLALLIFLDRASLSLLIIGLMGTIACLSFGTIIYIFKTRRNNTQDQESLHYGFHTTAATLLSGLILTDKFLINEYLSAESLAIYAIALLFPEQMKSLYSIFNQIFIPHITAANDVRAAWEYLKPKLVLLFAGFTLISLVGFLLIPVVIPLAFSERYVAAVPFAKWLWLGLGILMPFTFLGNILFAQQKKGFTYLAFIGYPILVSSLYLILIPQYGLPGAILAKVLSSAVLSTVYACGFYIYLKQAKAKS
jgi:O-antigen/teichoic acid export membrane protein